MTNLHYIIVVLIILSALIFLGAFSYHQKLIDREPVLAKKISSVTSVLVSSSELTKSEPQLVSDARGVTEEKAIKWSIYFSVSLLIITIGLIAFEKIKIGKKDMQVPLLAASIILSMTMIVTTSRVGIL
jgi:hypothetical protein